MGWVSMSLASIGTYLHQQLSMSIMILLTLPPFIIIVVLRAGLIMFFAHFFPKLTHVLLVQHPFYVMHSLHTTIPLCMCLHVFLCLTT